MSISPCFAGCDVSRAHLDVVVIGEDRREAEAPWRRFANDADGHAALVAWLGPLAPACVVLEASGGYEGVALEALLAAGVRAARINAARARDFARSAGLLAKTDRVDALALALFARAHRPAPSAPLLPERRHLRALIRRRETLVARRAGERRQLRQAAFVDLRQDLEASIRALGQTIRALDRRIAALLETSAEWRRTAARLRSVPGLGPQGAAVMIALMPELGRLSRPGAAALAGLAPFARDSGAWRGRRRCQGGRKAVRDALWMAALSAVFRKQTRFSALYRRLTARGKPHKLALTAVARKLLITLNAIERRQTLYAE